MVEPTRCGLYHHFNLVLMVNHACNLRCRYCYTGKKFSRPMPREIARRSVDRAIASLEPNGTLELGFFGGEPLIEAELIAEILDYSLRRCESLNLNLLPSLTTNGTQASAHAWALMTHPALDLVISHDGLPHIHDRYRHTVDGRGSSSQVIATIQRLLNAGKEFRVLSVVRPDTVDFLAEGIRYLYSIGVKYVEPSLDIWSRWRQEDIEKLKTALPAAADVWRDGIPDHGVSCFDEKVVQLTSIPVNQSARCGFGDGQIAVAPSGNLYPCERLIGDDHNNPMQLSGHAMLGNDFLPSKSCDGCASASDCSVSCRCTNFVRTGNVSQSDELLHLWNLICLEQAARVLDELSITVAN
jgi:uncharacterized protein